ncbi:hypothetical protein LPJ66_001857 [Kickxella alabastrina]|uniref:Uncharacterized protein n=1 Tax=Kickxella alabastrina TaxID=61397 RepID=A0ACC1ISD8_9FUNG|nr:hypothetical protein LPJ66_001857 [Kickxella alabastrina]
MPIPIDKKELTTVCTRIVREGDLDTLTDRAVRRGAEERMGLDDKLLDQQPYKQIVKGIVVEVLEVISKEKEKDGAEDEDEDEDEDTHSDDNKNKINDDADTDADDASKVDGSEEEGYSDVADEDAPKPKPKKRAAEPQVSEKSKRVKSSTIITAISSNTLSKANEATISNLKSYINKCGLRKVWAKELSGMNAAQQIRHLKKLLDDLGMEGRPTLEKCKKIKDKRELQAELEAMDNNVIIDDRDGSPADPTRRSRATVSKQISYNMDDDSESEDEEGNEAEEVEDEGKIEDEGEDKNEDEGEDSDESDVYTESESDVDEAGPPSDQEEDQSSADEGNIASDANDSE